MDKNKHTDDGYETPEEEGDNNSVDNNAPNTPNSLSDAFSNLGIKRNKSESDDNDYFDQDEELENIHEDMNLDVMNEDEYVDRYKSKRYKQNNSDDQEEMPPADQNGGTKKRKRKNKIKQKKTKSTKKNKKRNYKKSRKYNKRKSNNSVKKRTKK
jgi:hypothetical protein